MTKKDYEKIAYTIRNLFEPPEVRERVAKEFARELTWDNPRFDRAKFLKACGVTEA